jgi:hypothetical protein
MWLSRFRAKKKQQKQITEIIIASRDLQLMYIELTEVQNVLKRLLYSTLLSGPTHDESLKTALAHAESIQKKLDVIIIRES